MGLYVLQEISLRNYDSVYRPTHSQLHSTHNDGGTCTLSSHYQHFLHSLSPASGQEHTTFSDKEVWPLHEHHCCKSLLCVANGSGRKD